MQAHDWRPTASIATLKKRAVILAQIRSFFHARDIWEVETPLLSHATVTDPNLAAIIVPKGGVDYFLQTSPEYAMKRLLAAGSGSIYQMGKVFRDDERGRFHNPEFTMLEWYHVGASLHALMDEVEDLLQWVLQDRADYERLTYADCFMRTLGFSPHRADANTVRAQVKAQQIPVTDALLDSLSRDDCLDLLMSHVIEPHLGRGRPTFVYDYPASMASLARHTEAGFAARFEVYSEGIELANGYDELLDPAVLARRFVTDNAIRQEKGLLVRAPDLRLLAAMEAGLPRCAGVALGVDRLILLAVGAARIDEVVSFPWEIC